MGRHKQLAKSENVLRLVSATQQLGAMGSAAAQHLAQRGQRVLGFDRFVPPHTFGSSHGRSRIIRQAHYEDTRYVPMLLRACELWRKLERESGVPLLKITGGLAIFPSLAFASLRSSPRRTVPGSFPAHTSRHAPATHPTSPLASRTRPCGQACSSTRSPPLPQSGCAPFPS